MKKILTVLTALFVLQNAVAFAEHKGADKDRQITVGNENAAKSGATSDLKDVKEKENTGKDQARHQAKESDERDQSMSEGATKDRADKKDKKAHKEKKNAR